MAFALTDAKADERDIALQMIEHENLARPGQTLMADKGYRRHEFEHQLNTMGITLIRTRHQSRETPTRPTTYLKPFRQIIESVNQTLKAQLDLERHGARKPAGLCTRVLQRLLALTTVIWHNETTNQPGPAPITHRLRPLTLGNNHLGQQVQHAHVRLSDGEVAAIECGNVVGAEPLSSCDN